MHYGIEINIQGHARQNLIVRWNPLTYYYCSIIALGAFVNNGFQDRRAGPDVTQGQNLMVRLDSRGMDCYQCFVVMCVSKSASLRDTIHVYKLSTFE